MAILTESLRELVEQVAVFSGAAHEQLILQRIVAQDAKLKLLRKRREALAQLKM
jgi:hypothetical protein